MNKVRRPTPVAPQPTAQYDFRWFNLNWVTWDVAMCNGCWPQEGGIDIARSYVLDITTLETGIVIGAGYYPGVGYILSLASDIPGFGIGDTYYMELQHPVTSFYVGEKVPKGTLVGYSTFLEVGINPPWCVAPWNSCSGAWVKNPRWLLEQEKERGT